MVTKTKIELWSIFCRCSFIQQYKDNVADPRVGSGRGDGTRIPYKSIMNSLKPEDWVRVAFKWADTPQGHDYWQEVRKGWDNFLAAKWYNYSAISKWYIDPEKERHLNILKQCSFFNMINNHIDGDEQLLRRKITAYPIDEWIGCFFNWDGSKEGEEFWRVIDGCWKRYVGTGEKEWISQWLDKSDVATAKTLGENFSVTIPKRKAITLDFKL